MRRFFKRLSMPVCGFRSLFIFWSFLAGLAVCGAPAPDTPFAQAVSRQLNLPADLQGRAAKLRIDQDGIVYILTTKGVARVLNDQIVLDPSYRPLAGKSASDIEVSDGRLYYLFPDEMLSNRRAGKFVHKLSVPYEQFAVTPDENVLLAQNDCLSVFRSGSLTTLDWKAPQPPHRLANHGPDFYLLADTDAFQVTGSNAVTRIATGHRFTAIAFARDGIYLGTTNGLARISGRSGTTETPSLLTRLPSTNITSLAAAGGDVWAGTTRGVWRRAEDGTFRYFASRRWLDDDHVIDLQLDPSGNVWALTRSGLNRIEFRAMTLAQKAAHYENKIRQRHIRYGFCAELYLTTAGDPATAQMIDTDNDGTWSNYYMASQAFRFGATGDEQARRNAWETFEALERLESINSLGGFPARTFERLGFKVSDPDRWHPRGDGIWEWKSHTSSDEINAHVFGCAVLYECVAQTPGEKHRIATFIGKVLDHILRNDWYLIDVDGAPTLWGRWNPEYVNWFPRSIYDRRLNSAQIISFLQLGYKITGKEAYKTKAFELMEKHGYLDNILISMTEMAPTPGYVHKGDSVGRSWNHSDDLLGFVAYWTLHRFAFNDELRAKYAASIRDHWELEKRERCPIWNFVHAAAGARDFDLDGALWTLRHFPLDLTDWSVANSHRQDITRKASNFREEELEELLPPDERRITRWNGHPFILDGGSNGHIELAGDEFLLPYWMGRYLKLIQ